MGTIAKVTAGGATHLIASSAYGECSTGASTVAKTVNITGDGTATIPFTLLKGTTIHIKFTNTNTAGNPTLNVNGTGAKPITKYGSTAVGFTEWTSWSAGAVISFTYDGTSWVMNDHIDDTDTHPSYTAFTGKPTANQTPGFGDTFTVSQISQSTNGQVSGTDRTVKIPNTLASSSDNGLMSSSDKIFLDNLGTHPMFSTVILQLAAGQTQISLRSTVTVWSYHAFNSSGEEIVIDFEEPVFGGDVTQPTFRIAEAVSYNIEIKVVFTGEI